LKSAKPVAQAMGFGALGLGFHHIPVSDNEYNNTKVTEAWALVNILGGELTTDDVIGEVQRLVPIPWQWEVKKHGHNSFLTLFPNAMELARMDEFGEVKVKNRPGFFIECKIRGTHEEVKHKLPEVWIQVGGIPWQLRKKNSFFGLWVLLLVLPKLLIWCSLDPVI
jgi:hypothetical protein